MPKENSIKRFQFFLNMKSTRDQNLFIWLQDESQGNIAKFLKDICINKMDGTTSNSVALKDKKLDVEIRLKETQIKINERRLLYYDTFGNSPSLSAKKAMTKGVINQNPIADYVSCYDEKNDRFQCPECGILFNYSKDHSDIAESKMQFADHYFQKHGNLSERLVKEMSEII